jgi:hypothetical protein
MPRMPDEIVTWLTGLDRLEPHLKGRLEGRDGEGAMCYLYHVGALATEMKNQALPELETDPAAARALLARLIGPITPRRHGPRLMAELQGNLPGRLSIDDPRRETLVPEEGLEPPRA